MKIIKAPLRRADIEKLKMGEEVWVEGTVYAARDAAHKRMVEAIQAGQDMPFEPDGQIMYYVGPCPAPPGRVIGSAGPTTSGRMDAYAPLLIERGLRVMIGKGARDQGVIAAMQKFGAVYLATVGGAGAYLAQKIVAAEIIAYPELGPEALYKLEVQGFPCIVAIDAGGNDIYNR
ncbi:MAG: FumA C-terminus/TtdB family hydratase beta subunit [Firmicutes bacterium]|nr:FumA C-terminus/TtdB family hydratase beta subunit [Bacillota bacterium]